MSSWQSTQPVFQQLGCDDVLVRLPVLAIELLGPVTDGLHLSQGDLEGGRNRLHHKIEALDLSLSEENTEYGQVGENWFHPDIKVALHCQTSRSILSSD